MSPKSSYPKEKIKILLLENIHPAAISQFEADGYKVKTLSGALTQGELSQEIRDVHLLGIRSKTEVDSDVLKQAGKLIALGCFCIGTNQVDLDFASTRGIPVFNAPFSNTRSVAELTIAQTISLARKVGCLNRLMHQGVWNKSAKGSHEVRNKTMGIVGYGHIGQQVGLLAEALGMRVRFYDIEKKQALGRAEVCTSLKELLANSDFVSLHVPDTKLTRSMIAAAELKLMRSGSYLLNLSRGSVVDIGALKDALASQHLAGAALDVFPVEPKSNQDPFESELKNLDNVILTPHVGGSTEQAQSSIGLEVANSLLGFLERGSSIGACNFPALELPILEDSHRVLNIHKNVPGVLGQINGIIAEMGANIRAQYLGTNSDIGYLIIDVDKNISRDVKKRIEELESNIRTRLVF